MQNVKLMVLGDGGIGKSCLLTTYTSNQFPDEFIPTIFDKNSLNVMVDGRAINIGLWEPAGGEDYARLRPLTYPGTDVFLLCFSVDRPSSFDNIETYWEPEISHHCPGVPFLIVGLKSDLRDDEEKGLNSVPYAAIEALGERIGACMVLECSSLVEMIGVKEIFEEAIRFALHRADPAGPKLKGCVLL
jgi:small GTP-binding protein